MFKSASWVNPPSFLESTASSVSKKLSSPRTTLHEGILVLKERAEASPGH
jgi:hypothetical protein